MDKFKFWASKVEKSLLPSHPKLKHCHACEILAAAFGHKTYASFHLKDENALNLSTKYIILDSELALDRAKKLQYNLTCDEWATSIDITSRSGNSGGNWLINASSMLTAARLVFEDSSHQKFDEIEPDLKNRLGNIATNVQYSSLQEHLPDNWNISSNGELKNELEFIVEGDFRYYGKQNGIAVPFEIRVIFERVGKRFYSEGILRSVIQNPSTKEFEPDFEPEFCYFSGD